MAMTQLSLPSLGAGLKVLLSSATAAGKSKQRRRATAEKKRPAETRAFGSADVWCAWSEPGARLAGAVLRTGGDVGNARSFGGSENHRLSKNSPAGISLRHLTRIAAANSSSSSSSSASSSSSVPGASPGAGATTQKPGREGPGQYGASDGTWIDFEKQGSSDARYEGWDSEEDDFETGSAESGGDGAAANGSLERFNEGEYGTLEGGIVDETTENDLWEREESTSGESSSSSTSSSRSSSVPGTPSVGSKEPVYEVIEVRQSGTAVKKLVSRRQLLRTSGLRLRDLRRVDPSLWVTNSAPALLVRDQAILLNLGSLRAIATTQEVLIFDLNSIGAQSFIETLLPRLNDRTSNQALMPFELEVIESALMTRTQRVEKGLTNVEPRVLSLLELLPTCMTADVLEELRLSKQELVEVASKAGALRQMLLELLEHPQDIRRMVIMGRVCHISKDGSSVDCALPQDKQESEDEEEEMEMLLEYYLQRCESCHGQALKLLSSAKEMEDSIAVNLSSRRLEVNKLELLLQVGTFCAALGALVAGIFGMNLKSYLEERALAFWFTTAGILFGGIALFFYMFTYLNNRKIL